MKDLRFVAEVAIDPRVAGSDAVYTYLATPAVRPGQAFFIPIGTRTVVGFVMASFEATEEEIGIPFERLKPLGAPILGIDLPELTVELARFTSEETLCPFPAALSAASPPGIRERLVSAWSIVGEAPAKTKRNELRLENDPEGLTATQKEILRTMRDEGGTIYDRPKKKLPTPYLRSLRLLEAKGLVRQESRLAPFSESRTADVLLRLSSNQGLVERFIKAEAKRKPAQVLTLMQLQEAGDSGGGFTSSEIKALAGVTDTTIKALLHEELIVPSDTKDSQLAAPPVPNPSQKLAIDAIVDAIEKREARPFLLFGVTGSGKTEVYLRAAAEALRAGRQVLYLVPEIALATQTIGKLRERFGRNVAILHSELSTKERLQNFVRIKEGSVPVVLGARSAVFAPLSNLGLIVMDEEHEGSYKQESVPRYHAKRLASFLSERHKCPLVLGSATPSIESFFEAEEERLTLLTLPQRAASAQLPQVFVEDLAEGYRSGRPGILTPSLSEAVERTLQAGNQTILFLNRRAYAPFLICRDCGRQMMCPRCAVSLSFHRRDNALRCHHCGYRTLPPEVCPDCHGSRIAPLGIGTEKVEEAVRNLFPSARVARLDRDIARRKGALEEVLTLFRSGEIDVLVGTQMIAKGLDFPNVTLVGVIAADVSLNLPDFRAAERTFQLLSQVAGRSGRGSKPGSVIIQTFNPLHVAVATAQTHDYLGFYDHLKAERAAAGYPPFRRLINVVLSGGSRSGVEAAAHSAAQLLATLPHVEVLGPVDCVLERLKDRWRKHLLLKLDPTTSASDVGDAMLGFAPKCVLVVVDVDPYSLM